jgi:basic membrane protein A and related proteins
MRTRRIARWLVLLAVVALVATACGDDDDDSDASATTAGTTAAAGATTASGAATTAASGAAGACPGTEGCIPPGQPDVNGDGTVDIGILSPGDTNDNGYYESFVITAREYAEKNGWELIISDKINPADAQEQARNLCRQKVDMVAVAAGELADAIPVAAEDVCKGTVWYVAGGAGVTQTPYFFQTNDNIYEGQYATGIATGLVMKDAGYTKAGFVTGPEADFTKSAFNSWTAGIKKILPTAETVATYTGDFDDSAKGVEGAQAQISQGVKIMYPYLGGSTDAVADLSSKSGILNITPGTDRCSDARFGISSIFSPGDFFAAALQDFEKGQVKLGITRTFRIGVDPVPTVTICPAVKNATTLQPEVDAVIKQIVDGTVDPEAETKAVAGG